MENWTNPIRKVAAPKVPLVKLEPVQLSDVSNIMTSCLKGTFTRDRNKAILFTLLDPGCRAQDFLDLNIDDINLITREILILKGKWKKPRSVYIGNKSSKAIRRYLKHRKDYDKALWVRDDGREG